MTTNNAYPLSMYDVSRLAPAAVNVISRNAAAHSAIAAYTVTMVPVANEVLAAIQLLDKLRTDQVALIGRSAEQTAALNGLMLGWSGRLVRDIEGFDIGAFTRNAVLTFDVVQKATSLKQLVEQKGADLPYRETLLTELTARIDGAREADTSAEAARVVLQAKQHEVRELIGTFYQELIGLRRTVRAMLGSKSFEYQSLRVPVRVVDEPPVDAVPVTEPSDAEPERSSDG